MNKGHALLALLAVILASLAGYYFYSDSNPTPLPELLTESSTTKAISAQEEELLDLMARSAAAHYLHAIMKVTLEPSQNRLETEGELLGHQLAHAGSKALPCLIIHAANRCHQSLCNYPSHNSEQPYILAQNVRTKTGSAFDRARGINIIPAWLWLRTMRQCLAHLKTIDNKTIAPHLYPLFIAQFTRHCVELSLRSLNSLTPSKTNRIVQSLTRSSR